MLGSIAVRVLPMLIGLAFTAPMAVAQTGACTIAASIPEAVPAANDRLHAVPDAVQRRAHRGRHGQLVVGRDRIFLSHLPVFMDLPDAHPHNFQVILEVGVSAPDARSTYVADSAANGDQVYTAIPEAFEMTALIADADGAAPLRTVPGAKITRGHFEKGGARIAVSDLEVERIVHFREFSADRVKSGTLAYVLFGSGDDTFAAHAMSAPPDFDQILAISVEPGADASDGARTALNDAISAGAWMEVTGRANAQPERLAAGETLTCTMTTADGETFEASIAVTREVYCEAGEFDTVVTQNFNDFRDCE